eukprot:s453_g15.t1
MCFEAGRSRLSRRSLSHGGKRSDRGGKKAGVAPDTETAEERSLIEDGIVRAAAPVVVAAVAGDVTEVENVSLGCGTFSVCESKV